MKDFIKKLFDPSLLRFILVGCINTAVDYLVFYLLYRLIGLPIEICQAAGMLAAAAHGYMLNSNLTFSEGKGRSRAQFVQYVGVDVVLTILGSFFMGWIEQIRAPVFLVKLGVAIIVGLIHYVIYKLLVFRIKKNDKD